MKNYIYTFCFCLLLSAGIKAQQDLTLFNLNEVPQSSYANPANQFNGKFYLGLPAISSSYASLSNSGFAYSDFVKKDGDSLNLDFNSMIGELEERNFLSLNSKIDLISLGFKIGKRTQFTLNATENINFRFRYTKDFATFIHKGNTAFDDNTANFEGIGFSLNHYREYGLGISHQFGDKLRIGAKIKYLYGLSNINSKKTDLSLYTDPNTYALTATADVLINTSIISETDSLTDYIISGFDNSGFGLDLGVNYELSKRLSINASVLDLGYIDWNSNATNYIIDKGQYTFEGIAIDAFAPQDDTTETSALDRIADSLEAAFKVRETNEGYTTPLTGRIYLGANYKMNEKLVFGGLIQGEIYKSVIRPSFTASANYKLTKWIGLAASYSMINRSFNNLGVGININPGAVQIYVVSDNILSAIQPQHARHAQVRAGINFIFGSEKVKEINPSFDGVTQVKEKKEKKKKKKELEAEDELKETPTPIKKVVHETPETDTILAPKKPQTPEEKMDSLIEKKADTTIQKIEAPIIKTDSVVQKSDSTIEKKVDSVKQKVIVPAAGEKTKEVIDGPQIHPESEELKSADTTIQINTQTDSLKLGIDSVKLGTDSSKVKGPIKNSVIDSTGEKTILDNHDDVFEKKVLELKDSLSNSTKTTIPKVMNEVSPVAPDSLNQGVDSTGTKVNKEIKKAIEQVQEKSKTDSIPVPVPSVPQKAEPPKEPQ